MRIDKVLIRICGFFCVAFLIIQICDGAKLRWSTCGLRHKDPLAGRNGPVARAFNSGMTYRVLRGTKTKPGEYPWFVTLLLDFKQDGTEMEGFCAGVLLNGRWVLSVRHCCQQADPKTGKWLDTVSRKELKIGGVSRDDSNAELVETDRCFVHPKAAERGYEYDVSLIRIPKDQELPQPPPFDPNEPYRYNSICMPGRDVTKEDAVFELAGAGVSNDTESDYPEPSIKRAVIRYSPDTCPAEKRQYNTICIAYNEDKKNSKFCSGDSGAPLMYKGRDKRVHVVGLVGYHQSGDRTCEGKDGTVLNIYTNVWHVRNWIQTTMKQNTD